MPFVKVVKNKAFFKRYQVHYRRRREGKTDYQARKRLVNQDKTKYNSPKYRLVVRFTNTDVVAQIIYSKIVGDIVVAAAYSHELKRYGVPAGLTNYAAAYATGLLLARRTLAKLKLDTKYVGNTNVNGEDFNVSPVESGARPFRALLDAGLARTSTGAKVFAVLKGATDGGIDVPHSVSRFVGFSAESKKLDAAVLRKHIFGGHVADYMRSLKDEDEERYNSQFSLFIKNKITPEGIEALYANAHKAIRANPAPAPKKEKPKEKYQTKRDKKITLEERRKRVNEKKTKLGLPTD
eukprot:TRINITY_DN150_c0_g1_i1.p1 TRINITY_DN150_c0_g1~~TRINITY_DN150_c0_g1_i1.p1  ORF type:complete len:294 (-),score=67.31 TRINITY_DN150_c0_g1_i1:88-969(-)